MGFMQPTSGSGRLLGEPFGNPGARRRVGFLAESVALYHRRAERLVRFYGALNGMGGTDLDRRAREVLEIVGLQDHANRNAGKFSRGMLQRVGLAQAMVNNPELLILDEPTSALDPLARVMVRELLLSARNAGKTIFLSSHLLSEVELVCDRVAMLHRGKLARLGRTADLLQAGEQTEIVARAIAPAEFEGAASRDGVVRFFVPTRTQRAALEKVWNLGGEVISVNPVRRSLEEIFLEVTSEPPSTLSKGVH
jgi:ABC-2 type transport system ATP-binding protein